MADDEVIIQQYKNGNIRISGSESEMMDVLRAAYVGSFETRSPDLRIKILAIAREISEHWEITDRDSAESEFYNDLRNYDQ